MLTFSNVISFSRAAFVLAFLQENPLIRVLAILLAMLSDFLDGFIARRTSTTTQLGAILDPIMDKFFVLFAGGVLYLEQRLCAWELMTLFSRDVSLCFFGLYLGVVKKWKGYECRAIWWGKITTVCQFFVLIGLTLQFFFPPPVYLLFTVMGAFAFVELLMGYNRKAT